MVLDTRLILKIADSIQDQEEFGVYIIFVLVVNSIFGLMILYTGWFFLKVAFFFTNSLLPEYKCPNILFVALLIYSIL